jgi:hypothetical protein
MHAKIVSLRGKVPGLKEGDAKRLAAYAVRGGKTMARVPLAADGSFRLDLSQDAALAKDAFGLNVTVAPAALGDHLHHISNAPQIAISREKIEQGEREVVVPSEALKISDAVLKIWWGWCFQYCVSGTLVNPQGCPVPGADVTVYSVGYTGYGYSKVPRATVVTDQNGQFTACFEWCTCAFCFPCWPCWPIWWECWPWWWEWDILRVIEALEQRIPPIGPGPVERSAASIPLIRPDSKALIRGEGFAAARHGVFGPDAGRTAMIKNKLTDARLRAIFPWWWWCCDDPNIIFRATQGGNVILDEDPATATRWCFEDGSNVTLIAGPNAIPACPGEPQPDSGFAWTRVGLVTVDHIDHGYAEWWGGDSNDAAFAGTLDIYGAFAPGTPVSFYQVDAGQWTGNPARGGTAPVSSSPLGADLYNYVYIYDGGFNLVFSGWIKMGPFNQSGLINLYATEDARQNLATPPGLPAFPGIPAGGFALWAYRDRKVYTLSSTLVGGNPSGAVDLTLIGYDSALNPVGLAPDAPLTLTTDNTPLTTAHVNSVKAFLQNGSPAPFGGTPDCPTYTPGVCGYVQIDVTVSDANGHLLGYYVDAEFGHGNSAAVTPPGVRGYVSNPLFNGPDPNYAQKSWIGGSEVMTFPASTTGVSSPPPDCCYEFRIRAAKRVTDGYGAPGFGDYDFQTVGLTFSTPPCS